MYSDTSNIVNLNQAPALLDIFPVDNTPGSCMVYYADGWVYIPSDIDSTDLMVAVRDEENTSDLDLTQVIGYIDATEQVINGVYVLKRHFDIMPVNSSNAKVRLYFSDAELQSLMLADPSITGINDLVVQKFPTGTTTSGQIIVPDLAVSNMPFFGVHYLEISLTGFSSFYIHSSNYTALPVSWASVQASCRATGTELNWATFSEQNNAYFEIRKSADLNHWDILARVEGAGNSNSLISYSYLDAENETGIQYYQVMQVDYNGNYSHSPIAVAQCEKELMLLPAAVYPNPANHYVVFEVPSIVNGKWLYTLIDASGKTLKMESIMLEEGNNTLYESIETLMPGLYQARFNSESGQQVLLKFVKISN